MSTKIDSTLTLVRGHLTETTVKHGESTERAAAHAGGSKIENPGKVLVSAGKGLGADVKQHSQI